LGPGIELPLQSELKTLALCPHRRNYLKRFLREKFFAEFLGLAGPKCKDKSIPTSMRH